MTVLILNGPNLNLLGQREPHIYGKQSFGDYLKALRQDFPDTDIAYFQSNHEGAIIDKLHEASSLRHTGVVLNAGAYTHTSIAIADAIAAIEVPVIEVHISNTAAREPFRQQSYMARYCLGSIAGFGLDGYHLALHYLLNLH